jgi:hypothetical protein
MSRNCLLFVPLFLLLCHIPASAPAQVQYLEITIPFANGLNPAARTPVATYEWRTLPGSPDPVEVRWIMVPTVEHNNDFNETEDYIRNNPDAPEWSPWTPYSPPSTGTSWTSPPLDLGLYVFAVQGKDGSGVVGGDFTLDRNMRRVLISNRSTGPLLSVTGEHIDDIVTTVTTTPVTEISLLPGTAVQFCWEATADDYGLPVVGYRYGWDIADPEDDDAWPMPFTPFAQTFECSAERTFTAGVHTFYVEVIDYDGFKSRVPIQITFTTSVPVENTNWGRIKSDYKD